MDPKAVWPVLALAFGLLAAWQIRRAGNGRGAARTWALMAVLFTAVSLWLHLGR